MIKIEIIISICVVLIIGGYSILKYHKINKFKYILGIFDVSVGAFLIIDKLIIPSSVQKYYYLFMGLPIFIGFTILNLYDLIAIIKNRKIFKTTKR